MVSLITTIPIAQSYTKYCDIGDRPTYSIDFDRALALIPARATVALMNPGMIHSIGQSLPESISNTTCSSLRNTFALAAISPVCKSIFAKIAAA
jgi:hypothetical protein